MLTGITNNASPSTLPQSSTAKSGSDYKLEFLMMMLAQMKNQDPTAPVDSTQMLAQQAQFASLEQMQNLNTTIVSMLAGQNVAQATSMIGKAVTGKDSGGTSISGTVTGVSFATGSAVLKVDIGGGVSKDMALPDVTQVGA